MLRRLLFPVMLLAIFWALVPACNLSDDTELPDPECLADNDCPDGVCDEEAEECHQCIADEHCPGDEICRDNECRSGCDEFDCGDGGTCVDEDSHIACECDDGHFLDDGICHVCDCDIEDGTGECEPDGTCIIASCDEGYFTEDDDPATGCECGPEDWPDPTDFADRNCDGVDGDASRAVFVSPFGDDDHDGIRTRPVETIHRALELASDSDSRDQIFIAEGEYDEVIDLDEPISLFGGYFDAGLGEWERGPEYETVITGEGLEEGHRPVEITSVDGDVELQRLTIRADDAPVPPIFDSGYIPESSAALTLFDNPGHVTVSHVILEAGDGADGVPGQPGSSGADGEDGNNGYYWLADDDGGKPGQPTTQSCDFSDAPQAGAGGTGRESGEDANPSEDGDDAPGTDGGDGGERGLTEIDSQCGTEQSGTDGADGGDATGAGDDGDDGQPAFAEARLQITDEEFLVYRGSDGEASTDGHTGYGGGGGGGGGGSQTYFSFGSSCLSFGGGGGGAGGNGGCGGQGGEPGQWGGASIGILAHDTSFSISHSGFALGDGGNGGDGGTGGDGGDGGQGGIGGEEGRDDADNLEDAGNGGDGSSGGDGGGGAGGTGGPSIGILYGDADLDTEELSFELGGGGQGGMGGGDDNDGLPGLAEEIVEADAEEGD